MNEKEILKLNKEVKKLLKKNKAEEALEILKNILKESPDHRPTLSTKANLLKHLGKYEEYLQTLFQHSLVKIRKERELHFDIDSPEAWIEEAITLTNEGRFDYALE